MWRDLAYGFRQLLYPNVCAHCGELVENPEADFCGTCIQALTSDPHFTCPRCASSVSEQADLTDGCRGCREESYAFEACSRLSTYDSPLREAILAMKHQQGERLAECLGRLWASSREARFRAMKIDLILPGTPGSLFSWNQREGFARALIELVNRLESLPDLTELFAKFKHGKRRATAGH